MYGSRLPGSRLQAVRLQAQGCRLKAARLKAARLEMTVAKCQLRTPKFATHILQLTFCNSHFAIDI